MSTFNYEGAEADRHRVKTLIDVLKHVTTLCTGALVLVPPLLSVLHFPFKGQVKIMLALSFLGFVLSVVFALHTMYAIALWEVYDRGQARRALKMVLWPFSFGLVFFSGVLLSSILD